MPVGLHSSKREFRHRTEAKMDVWIGEVKLKESSTVETVTLSFRFCGFLKNFQVKHDKRRRIDARRT